MLQIEHNMGINLKKNKKRRKKISFFSSGSESSVWRCMMVKMVNARIMLGGKVFFLLLKLSLTVFRLFFFSLVASNESKIHIEIGFFLYSKAVCSRFLASQSAES